VSPSPSSYSFAPPPPPRRSCVVLLLLFVSPLLLLFVSPSPPPHHHFPLNHRGPPSRRFARCFVDSPAVLLMGWRWCRLAGGVVVGPLGRHFPRLSSPAPLLRPSSSLPFPLSFSLLPRPPRHCCCRCRSPSPCVIRWIAKTSHDKRGGSCFVTYHRGLTSHGSPPSSSLPDPPSREAKPPTSL
jgi:hypothetical protein